MNINNQFNDDATTDVQSVDYWQVIKNRYGLIILTFLIILLTAAVVTYVMPKKYRAEVTVQINPEAQKTIVIQGADSGAYQVTQQFFATQFAIIKSEENIRTVVKDMKLAKRWKISEKQAINVLKGSIDTQQERGTDLVKISVTHSERTDVKQLAEAVAEAYRKRREAQNEKRRHEATKELREKLRKQADVVTDYKKKLKELSNRYEQVYYGANARGMGNYSAEEQQYITEDQKYKDAKSEMVQLEILLENLQNLDDKNLVAELIASGRPEAALVKEQNDAVIQAKAALSDLRANGLGERHLSVIQAKKRIAESQRILDDNARKVRSKLSRDLKIMASRVVALEKSAEKAKNERMRHGDERSEVNFAKDDYEEELASYKQLKEAYDRLTLGEDMDLDPIVYHSRAEAPGVGEYVSPKWMLNITLGAAVGLLFGIGVAIAIEMMDTSIKSIEDVERYLKVPVLTVVPQDVGVLHKQAGASPDAEAYRILRTNIEFNRKNPDDNAITVVSGGASEGKSTTMVNLAYICAQGGYSTLMIDADLRRPRLHTFFDINNTVGLTNYLTTDLMLEDVILQTPVDNLFFMPSGILPADAAGILNSRRMSELIKDVKQRFDLVLVDSPPILGVSDASVLASEVDLTMIVIQHRKLPRNMLIRVKQAVENVGGTVLGVVLNNVDVRSDSQYQYYTSYYTYYAPSDVDRRKTAANAIDTTERAKRRKEKKVSAEVPDEDIY